MPVTTTTTTTITRRRRTYCDVLTFLFRSFQATMGCFFDCFRFRSDSNHPHPRSTRFVSDSSPTHASEEVPEKIRISSLFAVEEKEENVVKDQKNPVRRVHKPEIDEGLVEEAKLLKACGTLPQTPAEIRKAVKFSDLIENSEMKNPLSTLQSSPKTPAVTQTKEILSGTSGSENSGRPCDAVELSSETPEDMKKVEFNAGISEKSDAQEPRSMMKASPYPTPRRITDDMQTPGTVYATNMKSLTEGNARIRSQYVYTVSNPIDSSCRLDDLDEEPSATHLTSDLEGENLLQSGDATPLPAKDSSGKSINDETLGDVSLSAWLKPPAAYEMKNPNVRKTPGDRPIIGLVAAHWNEQEETPQMAPKWWDGNGIPNSTTKYKEDQKVRWHATPFEERLEKALSEESCGPQRKPVTGAPIIFEESEGQDTATSQLQTAPKSVVSF